MTYRVYTELELPPEAVGPSTHDWVKDSFLDFGARFGDGARCEVVMLNSVPPAGSEFERAKLLARAVPGAELHGPSRFWFNRRGMFYGLTPVEALLSGSLLVLIGWLIGVK